VLQELSAGLSLQKTVGRKHNLPWVVTSTV